MRDSFHHYCKPMKFSDLIISTLFFHVSGQLPGGGRTGSGPATCRDFPNWHDTFGDGCSWYEHFDPMCSFRDCCNIGFGTPAEACCVCGGGYIIGSKPDPSSSEPSSPPYLTGSSSSSFLLSGSSSGSMSTSGNSSGTVSSSSSISGSSSGSSLASTELSSSSFIVIRIIKRLYEHQWKLQRYCVFFVIDQW